LVLHSTLGVVVASGSGSRGILSDRLGDNFGSVIHRDGGARRGDRARLVGKDKRSGRVDGRGVSGLIVVVGDGVRDVHGVADLMLITEGRGLSLASLGRFGEVGRGGKIDILEGVVSGEGVGESVHAGDRLVLEHCDRSAGRNRHIKLRDGLGCGREVTGDSDGHQLDADGTRSGEVVVDGACAALEALGDALDEVGDRHSDLLEKFVDEKVCGNEVLMMNCMERS
jgi:hypothetical protein